MKKFIKDFQAFIKKGNAMDLAVGVIIGGAFGKIVTSLVSDMLTPFIVLAVGKTSLNELVWTLRAAVVENGEIITAALTVNWGKFLQTVLDFLVIALIIFLILRTFVRAKTMGEKLAENAKTLVHKHILGENEEEMKSETGGEEQPVEPEIPSAESAQVKEQIQAVPDIEELSEPSKSTATQLSGIEQLLTEIRDSLKKD